MDDTIHANEIITEIRDKYLKQGLSVLTDKEKLILLLSYAEPPSMCIKYAERASESFGSLSALMDSDAKMLINEGILGKNSAVLVNLIPHLKRRRYYCRCKSQKMNNSEAIMRYIKAYLAGSRNEIITVTAVDSNFNVLSTDTLGYGDISAVLVSTRNIADFAVRNKAFGIFMAHCHPQGSCAPSDDDVRTTKQINKTLETLKVILIDHIIIGKDGSYSMRKEYGCIFNDAAGYIISSNDSQP